MRVLVVGGTGVAGSAAVPALVAAGHDVTVTVRGPAKADQVRAWGATTLAVDVFDPVAVRGGVDGQEAVCNLSTHIPSLSRAGLPGAWRENDRLRRQVSANLVGAALETDCRRFVQESIGFVYPDRGDRWIGEDTEPAPTSVTQSALDAEAKVARFGQAGRIGVVLRFAQFYGPGSVHSAQTVQLAARFGIGPFPGDPDGFSSWIHRDDLGPAVVSALEAPAGIYNLGDDEPIRRGELHALFAEELGRRRLREVGKWVSRLGGRKVEAITRSQRLSNAAFKAATGWAPRVGSAREGWPSVIAAQVRS
ncbi:MAG TPA: NAD(P)-dependent oxidoreductase [Acidimicrobiales bacterium]|nr:NAD(P)-dependent oxidoreductase [Acidimicrobiales bacterium]